MVSFRKQPTSGMGPCCGRYATEICRKWTSHLPCNNTIVQRSVESKGKGKVSILFSADPDTVDTIYRIILSVNQLSIYGAVAAICDECDVKATQTARENPLYWRVSQLFLEKSKLKHLLVKNLKTPKSFCRNIFNKSIRFHQKTD